MDGTDEEQIQLFFNQVHTFVICSHRWEHQFRSVYLMDGLYVDLFLSFSLCGDVDVCVCVKYVGIEGQL